jgi:hypothetical protein
VTDSGASPLASHFSVLSLKFAKNSCHPEQPYSRSRVASKGERFASWREATIIAQGETLGTLPKRDPRALGRGESCPSQSRSWGAERSEPGSPATGLRRCGGESKDLQLFLTMGLGTQRSLLHGTFTATLKGHDFSRAAKRPIKPRASAPAGCCSTIFQQLRSQNKSEESSTKKDEPKPILFDLHSLNLRSDTPRQPSEHRCCTTCWWPGHRPCR